MDTNQHEAGGAQSVNPIGQEFLRRQWRAGWLRRACWILFASFIVLTFMREPLWTQQLACIVIAPIAIVLAFAAHLTWKCPSCGKLFGRERNLTSCPKCGVQLQVSESHSAAEHSD